MDAVHFTVQQIYALLFIFARVGGFFAFCPGFSLQTIPTQMRVLFAFFVSLILTPPMYDLIPPMPEAVAVLGQLIAQELFVGLFMGLMVYTVFSVLSIAANTIATEIGLANSIIRDDISDSQSQVLSSLFNQAFLVLFFMTDNHHVLIRALYHSYDFFDPRHFFGFEDFARVFVSRLDDTFLVALQLSMPFIALSLLFDVAMGVVGRLAPQIQVFFVLMPAKILLLLGVIFFLASAILTYGADFVARSMTDYSTK